MRALPILTVFLALALTARANPSELKVDLSKSCQDQKTERGAAMTTEELNLCNDIQNRMGGWKTGGIASCEDQKAAGGMNEEAFKRCQSAQEKSKPFLKKVGTMAKTGAKLAVGVIIAIVLACMACVCVPIICIVVWCFCCKKAVEAGSSA